MGKEVRERERGIMSYVYGPGLGPRFIGVRKARWGERGKGGRG